MAKQVGLSLGERIKRVRGQHTQKVFADSLGVAESTVRRWEQDATSPQASDLIRIGEVYKVSPAWLLSGEGAVGEEEDDQDLVGAGQGPTRPETPLKPALLAEVIEGVEVGLDRLNMTLEPSKKADLILLLYEHFLDKEKVDSSTVERFLKLVA